MIAACHRVGHRRLDPGPLIFDDFLAEDLVGEDTAAKQLAALATVADVATAFRASTAVRARLAEDVAIEGLADGRHDYVLLGAGLDSFAWRQSRRQEFTIWEVDHPDTQAWKRARLAACALTEPDNVRFVAADLNVTSLESLGLPSRATWNWLGVTVYLSHAATMNTLRAIAATGPGACVVVDFSLTDHYRDEAGAAMKALAVPTTAAMGEPYVGFYAPDEARAALVGAGFGEVELLDAEALNDRYLRNHPTLRYPSAAVIAIART